MPCEYCDRAFQRIIFAEFYTFTYSVFEMINNITAAIKRTLKTILWRVPIFQYCYLLNNPFKIYEWVRMNNHLEIDKKAVVLDLGCGNGTQTIRNARKFQTIIGIDPNGSSIAVAKDKLCSIKCRSGEIQFFNKTIENMNFRAQYFDGVVSYCVLEHINNYEDVLSEIYRILKPDGWVLLSVDSLSVINDINLLDKHREEHHVIKYFKSREIEELLAKKGFKDIKVEPLLKSRFAEKLFKAGIMNSFRFPRGAGLIYTVLLFITERFNRRNNEGLFILVKAYVRAQS